MLARSMNYFSEKESDKTNNLEYQSSITVLDVLNRYVFEPVVTFANELYLHLVWLAQTIGDLALQWYEYAVMCHHGFWNPPIIIPTSGNGNCLLNAVALGLASELQYMSEQQQGSFINAVLASVTSLSPIYIQNWDDGHGDFSSREAIEAWCHGFLNKDINKHSDRMQIESNGAPVLRHLGVLFRSESIKVSYGRIFDGLLNADCSVEGVSSNNEIRFKPFFSDDRFLNFSDMNNGSVIDSLKEQDAFQYGQFLAVCDYCLSPVETHWDPSNIFSGSVDVIRRTYDSFRADVRVAQAAPALQEDMIRSLALPNIMCLYLKQDGILDQYLKKLSQPGIWMDMQELFPMAEAWGLSLRNYVINRTGNMQQVYAYPDTQNAVVPIGLYYHQSHYSGYFEDILASRTDERGSTAVVVGL